MTQGAIRNTIRESGGRGGVQGSNRVRWVGPHNQDYRVQAYRCDSCGYVELTATEPLDPIPSGGCAAVLLFFAVVGAGLVAVAGQLFAS